MLDQPSHDVCRFLNGLSVLPHIGERGRIDVPIRNSCAGGMGECFGVEPSLSRLNCECARSAGHSARCQQFVAHNVLTVPSESRSDPLSSSQGAFKECDRVVLVIQSRGDEVDKVPAQLALLGFPVLLLPSVLKVDVGETHANRANGSDRLNPPAVPNEVGGCVRCEPRDHEDCEQQKGETGELEHLCSPSTGTAVAQ